jgi:two-component sensor histidine kinase
MRPFSRPATLRGQLLPLVSLVAASLIALATIVVWQDHEGDKERAEEQLRDQAVALALAVDREFDRTEAALHVLGSSLALDLGEPDRFEAHMRAASDALGGQPITLVAPDGREVLSTLWAPGERRPDVAGSATARRVFANGRSEISDLHWGPSAGRHVISAAVPVFADGQVRPAYALCLYLRRDLLVRILAEQGAREGWNGAILDRGGAFVARTRRDDEVVGRPAPGRVLAALALRESGVLGGDQRNPEGEPAVVAYARGPFSGYAVVVGVPEESFLAPHRAALWQTLGVGGLIAAAGLLLALLLARRIAASLRVLRMLGEGAGGLPDRMPRAGVREVDDVVRLLADASRRRALLVAELNHRVKNTLATVQSVAAQTLRSARGDTVRFTHEFGQRLQVLAAAHNLLTAHSWGRTDLTAVVQAALGPWLDDAEGGGVRRVLVGGPPGIPLAPRQAQAVVLALHELATNAVKYGALSRAAGRVELGWSRGPDGAVELRWVEAGGPPVASPPERRGFGTRLLERALAQDLGPGAAVELRFEPAGLHARIRFRSWADDAACDQDGVAEAGSAG